MTNLEARDDLLGLIGASDPAYAGAATLKRILSDQNATLQKLFAIAPEWWSNRPSGAYINAPAAVTGLTLTQGSKAVSGTFPSWARGCTILLQGDPYQNRLANTTTLVRPYAGVTTAAGTGTLYNDSITLATDVISLASPVELLGERTLIDLRSRKDLRGFSRSVGHLNHDIAPSSMLADNKPVSTPIGYYVDRLIVSNVSRLSLRLSPLPDQAYSLEFNEATRAPRITQLSTTEELYIPQDYAEGIFLPLLRKEFSTWKHFEADASAMKAIQTNATEALQLLARLKPQQVRRQRLSVPANW